MYAHVFVVNAHEVLRFCVTL